ncbi:MAG: hypothetical protein SGPRY_013764 [Prymnesium sp.]
MHDSPRVESMRFCSHRRRLGCPASCAQPQSSSREEMRTALLSGSVGLRSHPLHGQRDSPTALVSNCKRISLEEARRRLEQRQMLMCHPYLVEMINRWWSCCESTREAQGGEWDQLLRKEEYIRLDCLLFRVLCPEAFNISSAPACAEKDWLLDMGPAATQMDYTAFSASLVRLLDAWVPTVGQPSLDQLVTTCVNWLGDLFRRMTSAAGKGQPVTWRSDKDVKTVQQALPLVSPQRRLTQRRGMTSSQVLDRAGKNLSWGGHEERADQAAVARGYGMPGS